MTTTTTVPTVRPTFVCRYPHAQLRFLVDAFGFSERAVHTDEGNVRSCGTWYG
ncbi:hypothetical protein I4I73_11965 [Pseudonocardia sp. KRD-184]|uniref:Uncharacterized protein n=1 Tax=Pseudonocardia oceani TaxID=2792013 RepID=A0ABS6U5B8_9PSEU|nr:hypothetical protein [Pseudonocardia oceani]MBW0092352.1 hypothetical protein [Pseudonocardia oceani]MBW0096703.1 hypothetical protein [Pseudonocardia oceani]MBW0111865.1 hypothetical protein [Pseudonocardia oceani]MBW0123978.1 hypothetical protein [Pseudonocardia oceani]MBW0127183.1 hypothetical protein [Pseudonocardia oceani]